MDLLLSYIAAYLIVGATVASVQFILQFKFNMFMIRNGSLAHSWLKLALWWGKICVLWIWVLLDKTEEGK